MGPSSASIQQPLLSNAPNLASLPRCVHQKHAAFGLLRRVGAGNVTPEVGWKHASSEFYLDGGLEGEVVPEVMWFMLPSMGGKRFRRPKW